MKQELFPWFFLEFHGSKIKAEILDKWIKLLNDRTQSEEVYHRFISDLPRFFFNHEFESEYAIISKLKLGADLTTDLVLGLDCRSLGFQYKLIELESPHDKVYTNDGRTSAKLNAAVQQILDWKSWIGENMDTVRRIFPKNYLISSNNPPSFQYQIIIGRRDQNDKYEKKKTQLSEEIGIEIRSYDYLSDILKQKKFPGFYNLSKSTLPKIYKEQVNQYINPFAKAFTYFEWKKITEDPRLNNFHMVSSNIEILLENRVINDEYFSKFKSLLSSLPEESISFYYQCLNEEMNAGFW